MLGSLYEAMRCGPRGELRPQSRPVVWVIGCIVMLLPLLAEAQDRHTITYDHNCYTIDGKDIYIYNGSIHYMRCPRPFWSDRLQKIKSAGFNTVQTIVPWNYHEPEEGRLDLTEFEDWVKLCELMGFYIIIRPGPYICGEWDNGGYPDWLVPKRLHLRSNEDDYIQQVEDWYDKLLPVIRRHLVTNGGGILMVQLENEYGGGAEFKREAIHRMFRMVKQRGIDVPLFACNTPYAEDNEDPIMAQINNGWDVAWCRWETRDSKVGRSVRQTREAEYNMPTLSGDVPGGGGLWSAYVRLPESGGWQVPPLDHRDYNVVAKTVWMEGAAQSNFYTVFGGTNFGYWGASYMETSYWNRPPVQCALLEPGGLWETYYTVKLIGQWLKTFGVQQVRSKPFGDAKAIVVGGGKTPPHVVEKVCGDTVFLFVREEEDRDQQIRVSYTDPMSEKAVTIPQNGDLSLPARDMHILTGNIPLSDSLLKYSTSQVLGIGKCGGRTVVVLYGPAGSAGEVQLLCKMRPRVTGDAEHLWDDSARTMTLNYEHGQRERLLVVGDVEFIVLGKKQAYTTWEMPIGEQTLFLASDCYFLRNHQQTDNGLSLTVEALPGPFHAAMVLPGRPKEVTIDGRPVSFQWDESARSLSFDAKTPSLPNVGIDFKRARFKPDSTNGREEWATLDQLKSLEELGVLEKGYVRYRATFPSDGARLMTVRFFEGSAKGGRSHQVVGDPAMVFVNGRYVQEASGWHPRKIRFDVAGYLREGENSIEVILEKIGRPCGAGGWGMGEPKGLASVSLTGGPVETPWMRTIENWQFKAGLQGQNDGYFKKDYDAGHWAEVRLGNWKTNVTGTDNFDGIGWYRLEFDPRLPEGWTIPLKLCLDVRTHALIYLNGVIVGRYNVGGWQREFYLPECWLNPNGKNVIALAVRNTGGPGGLYDASIRPYTEFSVRTHRVGIQN